MFIQDILTSKIIHRYFISHFIRNGILKTAYGLLDVSGQHPFIQSLIFWNVYERKEISAIKKYLNKELDIIELGSSIGMVSMALGSLIAGRKNKIISVEANPRLLHNLRNSANLNAYKIEFVNAAICYTDDEVKFDIDNKNLGSKITDAESNTTVVVESTTLGKLFHRYHIAPYALVCDIEGAESHIFSAEDDTEAIKNCRQVIIELHDTRFNGKQYTKKDLSEMIIKKFSMQLVFSEGDIWVFDK